MKFLNEIGLFEDIQELMLDKETQELGISPKKCRGRKMVDNVSNKRSSFLQSQVNLIIYKKITNYK